MKLQYARLELLDLFTPSVTNSLSNIAPTLQCDLLVVSWGCVYYELAGAVKHSGKKLFCSVFRTHKPSMKIYIRISIALFLAVFCSLAHAKSILVMGDSLSAGYGIQTKDSWVTLLQQKLANGNYQYDVINESISGETSDGGLRRFPSILQRTNPDIIILELGANDGLRGFPIPVIKSNLSQLVKMGLAKGAKILLLGIHIPPNYGAHYTNQFHALFGHTATENGIALVPFFLDGVAANNDYMQSDGLHPNAKGQPIILENIWPLLEPML